MTTEKLVFKLDHPHGTSEVFISWQRGNGVYLATTGADQTVEIYNRHGKRIEKIRLQGVCTGFDWDVDGDHLAIITSNSSHLTLWDANTTKKSHIDIGLRDPMSCIIWAKKGSLVAVGTSRGNLAIYNHSTAKRVPILGKHNKRISCGSWSAEGLLALGSEDRSLSISNNEGDTLKMISLRAEPSDIQFSEMKMDERLGSENTVSLLVGKRTLFLYNLHDPDNPVELAFQQRYGHVVTYKWFGDGYILLGFSAGYFVAISTHIKEVGQELFQVKNHRDNLNDIALCRCIGKVASCGDNTVKVHDVSNLQETSAVLTLEDEVGAQHLAWSEDGQLLAVAAKGGNVFVFLSRLPQLSATNACRVAVLTSLTELTVFSCDAEGKSKASGVVELAVEPNFIALGPYHCAAGMNNHAWFYELGQQPVQSLSEHQYVGTVNSLQLGPEYASALTEGKVQLHLIEPGNGSDEDREMKMFPDETKQEMNITCHSLTTDFLIYATDMGHIHYFFIEDWKIVVDFQHTIGIRSIYSNQSGSRVIFIDDKSEGYIYNPVTDQALKIPDLPAKCRGVLWDSATEGRDTFAAFDDSEIVIYVYIRHSVNAGTGVEQVSTTRLPANQVPVLMVGTQVELVTLAGRLMSLPLGPQPPAGASTSIDYLEELLQHQITLCRFSDAWKTCKLLNTKESWTRLGEAALKNLEVEFAIQVYQEIDDAGMVWALENIQDEEDRRLLTGHMAVFLKNFDKAQEWYLSSSEPVTALHMHRDLLQWDRALQLASKLAPHQTPFIAKEYAQQLEFTGNYAEALIHYEQGLAEATDSLKDAKSGSEQHVAVCRAGVARTSIRCGDVRRGVAIAMDIASSPQLKKECADILEGMKHLADAALLYEKGQFFEKAALTYIRLKNWFKVGELLSHISSPKIHIQYAKAKEADGSYREAVAAYEAARDFDNVIRVNLDYLNNPEDAVDIVRKTKSLEGAKMVAKFFQRLNDYQSAIRFLVMSQCYDEAFQLARQHGQMELYGEILSSSVEIDPRPDDFRSLALHFETEKNSLLAGKYYFHAGDYNKALKHLMKVLKTNSEDPEAISYAIDVVGVANDEHIANQLIEFLLGDTDGVPKDPKYLFRLYMARKQYREAAKTALIIANQEQVNGNYRNAHDVLLGMYQELRRNGIRIPSEMQINLSLLHSYILVRLHVRQGQHAKGARMLIRVAKNISKFPSHIVPILTSTVIECSRAGLRKSAFTYAAMLMRPEYRSQVDPKYAKKIEAVVRKPARGAPEEDESVSPCPYCNSDLPDTELQCPRCKNTIPFCIATGRHIVKDDLTACPHCDFPAIYTELITIVQSGELCPMCSENIDPNDLTRIQSAELYLFPQGQE
ncbi:WD repeat-containing protein 19 isoform X1 [Schistocerca cancellata]|uniref:WD repeat-containing protein 19 isoform X1 n=1 Tax=Schistocerca cancellata TaxID=274614 RepID=UPI00211812AA|nr:WD repeat-containing protein 19 isoform X1 [Schistocerca cancellata]